MARVSRLDVSREVMRARRVSISEEDAEPEDLRTWSSFSRDRRAVSAREASQVASSQRDGGGQCGLTFILKPLAHLFDVLEGLVGGGLELFASRLSSPDGGLELNLELEFVLLEIAKPSDYGRQDGPDDFGGGRSDG